MYACTRSQRYPDNSAKDKCERHQCEAKSANANSVKETTVRMRQTLCEGRVCEGQECECDFSAIGQNSEVIPIVRSRSFCLQDGVWFKKKKKKKKNSLSLSVSLFLSRVSWGKGRVTEPNRSSKNRYVKVDPNNSPNRFSPWIRVRVGVFQSGYG